MVEEIKQDEVVIDESTAGSEKADTNVEGNAEVNKTEDKVPYDRFKSKVDEANELKRKLQAYETDAQEAERKRLEEAQNYKELAETYKAELEAQKADAFNAKKEALLVKAGYTDEQVTRYVRFLSGDTPEEIQASLDELKADVPPKTYVDPSAGNGAKGKAEQTDASDIGRSAFERIKNRIR